MMKKKLFLKNSCVKLKIVILIEMLYLLKSKNSDINGKLNK